MKIPSGLLYHPEHTWAKVDGKFAVVGITDFAQAELGDVVFVDLPEVGVGMAVGKTFGSIESSKSISELFAPVAGKIVEVNSALEDSPELVNDDPYGGGWIVRVALGADPDLNVLLDAAGYAALTGA